MICLAFRRVENHIVSRKDWDSLEFKNSFIKMFKLFLQRMWVLCEKFRNLSIVSPLPIRINSDSLYRFFLTFLNLPQWNSRWGTQPEYVKCLRSFLPDGGKGDVIQSQIHSIHHSIRKLSIKGPSMWPVEKLLQWALLCQLAFVLLLSKDISYRNKTKSFHIQCFI